MLTLGSTCLILIEVPFIKQLRVGFCQPAGKENSSAEMTPSHTHTHTHSRPNQETATEEPMKLNDYNWRPHGGGFPGRTETGVLTTVQHHAGKLKQIVHSKLTIGVNVSVNGYFVSVRSSECRARRVLTILPLRDDWRLGFAAAPTTSPSSDPEKEINEGFYCYFYCQFITSPTAPTLTKPKLPL